MKKKKTNLRIIILNRYTSFILYCVSVGIGDGFTKFVKFENYFLHLIRLFH